MAALSLSTLFATNYNEGQIQKVAGDYLVLKFKYLAIIELFLRTIGSLAMSSFFRTHRETGIIHDQLCFYHAENTTMLLRFKTQDHNDKQVFFSCTCLKHGQPLANNGGMWRYMYAF